ncbi:hypothetical protein A3K63_04955 [Candidatus Micrarchaeota archaeon RBG_16_49_10]|nr:MAG: hypothetical protein A3K63_04955 [Candidatus Micrarchaeota archaeon RBG_16_49_10]
MKVDSVAQRVKFVQDALQRYGKNLFLGVGREVNHPENMLYNLFGTSVVGSTAVLIPRSGQPAIIGASYDEGNLPAQVYEVIGYKTSFLDALSPVLRRMEPASREIVMNFSQDEAGIDTLGHGLWVNLGELLSRYKILPGDDVISSAFGRRTEQDLQYMRRAIKEGQEILQMALSNIIREGVTETQIAEYMRGEARARGLGFAWAEDMDPIVSVGKNSLYSHHRPDDTKIKSGEVLFIDFGVSYGPPGEAQCSDIQNMSYVRKPGESHAPAEIQRLFQVALEAKNTGIVMIAPGVRGTDVDAAAREIVHASGYSAPDVEGYDHGFGHSLGRTSHEIGPGAFPPWSRYGRMAEAVFEQGNVVTAEPSVAHPEIGKVALEDDVLVTEDGHEVLNRQQTEIWYV